MKNNWYFLVLSSVVVVYSKNVGIYYFLFAYLFLLMLFVFTRRMTVWTMSIIVLSTGCLFLYLPTNEEELSEEYDQPITNYTLHGKIHSEPVINEKYVQFKVKDPSMNRFVLVTHFYNNDQTNQPRDKTLDSIQHGALCTLKGVLSLPDKPTNPHQFDYRRYLAESGISHQLEITSLEQITCTSQSIFASIHLLRKSFLRKSERIFSTDLTMWLHALVLGKTDRMDEEIISLFQRWNLSHILAISGLHVGIIVGIIYFSLLRIFQLTRERAQLILFLFLPLYALLAGGEPSVWRASLMVVLFLLLRRINIVYHYTDIVSIVYLLLLVVDKQIIYHIGFQFSFAVTFALLFSAKWLRQSRSRFWQLAKISFIAQMAILPLQVHYFHLFQPLSIIINIIIVPYFSLFVIPLMFFSFVMMHFLPVVLIPFDLLFQALHSLVIQGLQLIDSILFYPLIIGNIPVYAMLLYYVFFIGLMRHLESRREQRACWYGLLLSLLIIFLSIRPYFSPYGSVTMLDIGQGDAFVIELPHRRGVYFIDAGSLFTYEEMLPTDTVYKRVIQPYLYGQGIYKIDAIFISHDHVDHYGSVDYLLQDFVVDDIYINEYFTEGDLALWRELGANIRRITFNEKVNQDKIQFQIVSPTKDRGSANENSMVIYTVIGGMRWLFTGDAGKTTEKAIIKNFPSLSLDIIKVGHHGSNTSTDGMFLHQTKPSIALIPVGRNNHYGHPTEEVIDTLEGEGIKIYRTDRHGAVQFIFKGNEGTFQPFIND